MKKTFTISFVATLALACLSYACSSDDDDELPSNPAGSAGAAGTSGAAGTAGGASTGLSLAEQRKLTVSMHGAISTRITELSAASVALCAKAPETAAGWDEAAVTAMKAEWVKTREAYERIEGVIAPIYSDVDETIDQRYDYFIGEKLSGAPDTTPFDGEGVTGMHAIERILYKDNAPEALEEEEAQLTTGYTAPAFPATDAEALQFKNGLCKKLVDDVAGLEAQWVAAAAGDELPINLSDAYGGLLGLVAEQQEKVDKASTQLDESRYAKRTMADLRANLDGVKAVYALLAEPLVLRKNAADAEHDGPAIDAKIKEGFTKLEAAFAEVQGDAIPEAPEGWSQNPTPDQLATPFGKLFTTVRDAVDPTIEGSIGHEMEEAAEVLGIVLPEEEE
jgi:iron uptake system component EfeO